jgi:hypothetical protein
VTLDASVVPVSGLSIRDVERMHALMDRYYENVGRKTFVSDLMEKDAVTLVRDAAGAIRGFSTIMDLTACVGGMPVTAVFSGDTVIDRDCRGGNELQSAWARHVVGRAAARSHPTYWFLISKGYKTYRFLPVYFREFMPSPDGTDESLARIRDVFARQKFGDAYDPSTGLIRVGHKDRLRPDVAPVTARRLRDRHVRYFVSQNPGWQSGDELACIARISEDNMRGAFRRVLGRRRRGPRPRASRRSTPG